MEPFALYIHIPFCATKCPYCDFNTYAGIENLIPSYVTALSTELEIWGTTLSNPEISTIFFGGGTPSYIGSSNISEILSAAHRSFRVKSNAEITLEINPDDITYHFACSLHKLGINRLSMGVQSLDDGLLALLGRRHNAAQAERAYNHIRQAGFTNINLDLMYGLPTQSMDQWSNTIDQILYLAPEHMSLYCLTLELGTPMEYQIRTGKLATPDADLAADMYLLAEKQLEKKGYNQYEISNWARPDYMSKHNLVYWRNGSYIGVGPGAHSSLQNHRFSNLTSPREYLRQLKSLQVSMYQPWRKLDKHSLQNIPVLSEVEVLDARAQMGETMMLGLRLNEGIEPKAFKHRFGKDFRNVYKEELKDLQKLGLLQWDKESLKLTDRGRLLGDEVFVRFLN